MFATQVTDVHFLCVLESCCKYIYQKQLLGPNLANSHSLLLNSDDQFFWTQIKVSHDLRANQEDPGEKNRLLSKVQCHKLDTFNIFCVPNFNSDYDDWSGIRTVDLAI